MKNLLIIVTMLFSQGSFAAPVAATVPCVPSSQSGTHPYCEKFSGATLASYQMVNEPMVDFPANAGTQHAWLLAPGSQGAWRIRLMKFDMITPIEVHAQQQHFHQVAHSDLSVTGTSQELVYTGGTGFYRYEVECENDCAGKNFDLFVWVP